MCFHAFLQRPFFCCCSFFFIADAFFFSQGRFFLRSSAALFIFEGAKKMMGGALFLEVDFLARIILYGLVNIGIRMRAQNHSTTPQ